MYRVVVDRRFRDAKEYSTHEEVRVNANSLSFVNPNIPIKVERYIPIINDWDLVSERVYR